MALRKLSMQSIEDIDNGRIAAAVNLAIEQVVKDIDDRGQDKQVRRVQLDIIMKPIVQEGAVEQVETEFKVSTKIPVRRSRTYRMDPKGGKSLAFSSEAPEDPNQTTIDDFAPKPDSKKSS